MKRDKVLGIFLFGLAAFIMPIPGWSYLCVGILCYQACTLIWGGIPFGIGMRNRR